MNHTDYKAKYTVSEPVSLVLHRHLTSSSWLSFSHGWGFFDKQCQMIERCQLLCLFKAKVATVTTKFKWRERKLAEISDSREFCNLNLWKLYLWILFFHDRAEYRTELLQPHNEAAESDSPQGSKNHGPWPVTYSSYGNEELNARHRYTNNDFIFVELGRKRKLLQHQ